MKEEKKKIKKRTIFIAGIGLLVLILLGICFVKFHRTSVKPLLPVDAKTDKSISASNNQFGFDLFNKLVADKDNESQNVFISPLSLSMALTMTANGASGSTKTEMAKALELNDTNLDQANKFYFNSIQKAKSDKSIDFLIADSIWAREPFTFLKSFQNLASKYYEADTKTLKGQSYSEINDWVSDKTKGKITKIVNDGSSKLYLVNAVYFKANWADQFDAQSTSQGNFYLSNGSTSSADFMNKEMTIPYYQENGLQMASISYQGDYAMDVFLPSKGTSISSFSAQFDQAKYADYLSKMSEQSVNIKMPKYTIEYGDGKDLKNTLMDLGMVNSFSDQANFSNLSQDSMKIDQVLHKTYIKTDEKGTEAAAATSVSMESTASIFEGVDLILDHPYLFTIRDKSTNTILFLGTVENPTI